VQTNGDASATATRKDQAPNIQGTEAATAEDLMTSLAKALAARRNGQFVMAGSRHSNRGLLLQFSPVVLLTRRMRWIA